MNTLAPSSLVTSSFLQVTGTCMKAWMSLTLQDPIADYGVSRPWASEISMYNVVNSSSFIFD